MGLSYLHPSPAHDPPGMAVVVRRTLPWTVVPEVARPLQVVKRDIQAGKVSELEGPDDCQDDSRPIPLPLAIIGLLASVTVVVCAAAVVVPLGAREKAAEDPTSAHFWVNMLPPPLDSKIVQHKTKEGELPGGRERLAPAKSNRLVERVFN